jgi:hypothetical protein
MRYLRSVKDCTTLDHVKNEDIRKVLKMETVQNKIDEWRQNWMNCLDGKSDEEILKHILQCKQRDDET